jgi:subtilisin-like proprotein convertase family protein
LKKSALITRFAIVSILLGIFILSLIANPFTVLGKSLSPQESIQCAWQNAQKSGAYHYSTELIQTTYPAPTLANVGRTAQEDYLYIDGQTNLANSEMLMSLWKTSGSPATGQNGVEIRIQGDEAYGRSAGEDWQKINNFSTAFAPRSDLLAYLAGAKNVSLVKSPGAQSSETNLTQYAFELDGPQLGEFVRDQLEQSLSEKGKLPAGLTLGVSDQYLQMTGTGSVWLTGDHLPARLTIAAEFPQQENGQRLAVSIKTDFSGFAPIQQASTPLSAATMALASVDWGKTGGSGAAILLAMGLGVLILTQGKSRLIYAGVALATVFSMVFSPLYQDQKVYAFTQEQAASSAEAKQFNQDAQSKQDYLESLYATTWDPHQSTEQTANLSSISSLASPDLIAANVSGALPADKGLNIVPAAANTSQTAASSLDCSTTDTAKDTDNDGLTDCQEKNLGTDINNADTDKDGLTDGQEVLVLGTDPNNKDTDGDRIFDKLEVDGFSFNGQKWYTDPKNADTNQDGLTDGVECPAMTPEGQSAQGCLDTDGDKIPDIFDNDNDGDGVVDRADISPFTKVDGLTSSNPFILQANSIEPQKDVFVDFQIRPANPKHLTFAMNVLDWPSGDTEGQVTRIKDTTFASSLTTAQAAADPSSNNGDMRLTPMLEIQMDGENLPLPRTNPTAVRQVTASTNSWLDATVNFAQAGDQSNFTISYNNAGSLDEVVIYAGGCSSSTALATGAISLFQFTQVASNSQQTVSAKLLSLIDGAHAITFKQKDNLACLSLGDLPNGNDPNQMIDTAALSVYGISVRDVDNNGTVFAYAPLSMVNDQIGEQRQAFSAQMLYRQASTTWGNAQKIRLVWLVQLLGDDGFTQTIHVYKDDFTLTGLTLREDHGMNVSVAFENPKVDLNKNVDENLWQVAEGLRGGFISGRSTNNQRDLTLSNFKTRFDDSSNSTDALTKRWGISAGKVQVLNFTFPNQNGLADFPSNENQKILNQYFMNNGATLSAAPALIFAREEMYRNISLDSLQAVRTGAQVTLAMNETALPEQTLAAFNLAAFQYKAGTWQTYPLSQYMDLVGTNYAQYFKANPADFLQTGSPDYDKLLNSMVLVARSNQLALLNGEVGLVASGTQVLSNEDTIDRDMELAGAVGGGVSSIYSIVAGFAGDYFQGLANKSFASQALPKGSQLTKAALDEIGDRVEEYQKAGEQFKGNFANSTAWGNIGAGLGVACIALSIAASFSGSEAVQYVALALNVVASVYGLVDAIAKLTVNLAIKAASTVTDLVKGAGSLIEKAGTKSGAIGLIISGAISVGLFIYQMAASGSAMFSMAFDSALAGLVGQIVASVLMLVIASIPVVGQLIAAVLAVIDGLIALICEATGANDSTNDGVAFVCSGISGMLATVFTYYFYSAVPLVGNLKDDDRLSFLDFKPTVVNSDQGFSTGNEINYALTVRNKIVVTDPTDPPDVDVPNWKSLAYSWQFNEKNLRKSAFEYALQTTQADIPVTYDSMSSEWQAVADAKQLTLQMDTPLSLNVATGAPGLNQPVTLYLTEAYEIPNQECWALGVIPICYIRSDYSINQNDMGANIQWDIFPANLDDFYAPVAKDGGYSLAWGQTPASDNGVTFPRMMDFDGDGLLNKKDGGADPDDSTWDTDNDGLSDPYELKHGSDPQNSDSDNDGLNDYEETRLGTDLNRADSDGDGLTDAQEVKGWELVYGFDGAGVPLKTWVTSNPLLADADGDLVLDGTEKILGTNPNVVSSSLALKYETQIKNMNAASLLLRFEETSNVTSFADSSGQGHSVVCSGSQCPVSGGHGAYGNSVQFDGNDDALQVNNSPDLKGVSFSVAFWARHVATGSRQWIVTQKTGSSSQALHVGFAANNTFVCGFGGSELASGQATTDSNWHHWVCTYDADRVSRSIYLDGNRINNDSPPAYQGSGDVWIGSGVSAGLGGAFNGQLDELGIYRSALTPDMVVAVETARYETNDTIVRPGDQVWYTGVVKNELNNRTAQGLLQTETNSPFLTSQIPPSTFIIAPSQSQTLSGVLAVNASAPGGPITVTQVAGGQIVDWRDASNNAELWLKLDEAAGASSFADSSGVQPTRLGVCSGSTCPKSGENGNRAYAALFDGADDTLTVNNSANLKPNFLTIAGWIKANGSLENGAPMAAKGNGSGGNLWSLDFSANQPRMTISTVAGGSKVCMADQALASTTWYHVAGTYDGSAMTLYVNGKQVKFCTVTNGGTLAGNDHVVAIGSRQSGSGSYDLNFGGWLDDVRIFNKSLTASDINLLFGAPVFALDFEGTSGIFGNWYKDGSGSGGTTNCGGSGSSCPNQAAGMVGNAVQFSGQNYAEVTSTNSNLDLSGGAYTQSAWVYPEDRTGVEGIIGFNSGELTGSPAIQRVGKKLMVGFGTASGWKTYTTGDVLTISAWNHVAATFDGATYRVYVNGAEVGNSLFLQNQNPAANSGMWLGRTSNIGTIYVNSIYVKDEKDGPGKAELCMAWKSNPSTDYVQVWKEDAADADKTYSVDKTLTFTESGTLKMWEDDGGTYCGKSQDSSDDFVWSATFNAWDSPISSETVYNWTNTADSTGSTRMGRNSGPATPVLKLDSVPFVGKVDNVRIYRYAMTADQVGALYQVGTLPLLMHLDDPSGAGLSQQGYSNAVDTTNRTNGICTGVNTCPITGMAGRVSTAAQFDGVNDFIEIPSIAGLSTQKLSVTTWVKPNAWTGTASGGAILSSANTSGGNKGFTLSIGNSGKPSFMVSVNGVWCEAVSPSALSLGSWAHLAGTYDGAYGSVYVNGVLQATALCVGAITHATTALDLGRNPAFPDRLFNGVIDEARVYNVVLSAGDLLAQVQAAPVLMLHLDEKTNAGGFSSAASGIASTCPGNNCPAAGAKGQMGLAAQFDGVNDGIEFPDSAGLRPATLTAAAWIKAISWTTAVSDGVILSKASTTGGNKGYILSVGNNGQASFEVSTGGTWCTTVSQPVLALGSWTHLAGSYDGAKVSLYINGSLQSSTPCSGTISQTTFPFDVGQSIAFTGRHFNGLIDEVTIHASALSNSEINNLYALQAKYVEDRVANIVIVDNTAPVSRLESILPSNNYRSKKPQVLGIMASDDLSGVAMVELGVCSDSGCIWNMADACLNAAGSSWCPTFQPTAEGLYHLQTRATDTSGNREKPTAPIKFFVDGTPPIVTTHISNGTILPVSFNAASNAWLVHFLGTVRDPDIKNGPIGSGVARVWVTLRDSSGKIVGAGEQNASINADGSWKIDYAVDEKPAGTYTLSLAAGDLVGNNSKANPISLVVDLDASAPQVNLDLSSLPITILPNGTTLNGTVKETGTSFGIQSVDTAFLAATTALYNDVQPPDGVIRYFPFDDQPNTQGELTFSELANGENGACNKATSCPGTGALGHSGTAVNFDGSDDAVNLGDQINLANTSFTFSTWARRTAPGIDMLLEQGTNAAGQGLEIGFISNNRFTCGFYGDSALSMDPYKETDWHQWACTYDAATTDFTLYRDGLKVGNHTAKTSYQATGTMLLGRGLADGSNFSGALDDMYFFNRALQADEVYSLYSKVGSGPSQAVKIFPFETPQAYGGSSFEQNSWRLVAGPPSDVANKITTGKVGSFALNLDGVDDVVVMNHQANLNVDNVTVAGWVRPNDIIRDGTPLAAKGMSGNEAWGLDFIGSSPHLFFYISGKQYSCQAAAPVNLNAWTHVAGMYDGVTIKLYINGELANSCPASVGNLDKNTEAVTIGARQRGVGSYDKNFNGAIDDIRLYRRAISANEVKELFYTGWQQANLSASGLGVLNSDLHIAIPAGLEGNYRLTLRSVDEGGNFDASQSSAWSGSLDTLAPRAALVRTYPTSNTTLYQLSAEDFNLDVSSVTFSGCSLVSKFIPYQSNWYLALTGSKNPQVNRVTASCTVSGNDTQAVSAAVCDLNGNCTNLALGSSQQTLSLQSTDGFEIQPALLADVPISVNIANPPDQHVFVTDTQPVAMDGTLDAQAYASDLTVTVDSVPVLTKTWTLAEAITSFAWSAQWTPVSAGTHIIVVSATDFAGNKMEATSKFFVDTDLPTVTLTTTPYDIWYNSTGGVEIEGKVSDAGGIAKVVLDVTGPVNTANIDAVVNDGKWIASWPLPANAPIDGVAYTFTVQATDMAGNVAKIVVPGFIVDLTKPTVNIHSVTINGAEVKPGQVISDAAVNATITISATDNSPISKITYAWTTGPIVPEPDDPSVVTLSTPGSEPISIPMPLSVSNETGAMRRYLYVEAVDSWDTHNFEFWGPIYQDPPTTPDYIGMNEPGGPFAGDPYREWMKNSCTLLGKDTRVLDWVQEGNALHIAQNLYTTWDHQNLRLTWTGANWDHSGDLFIYLDTTSGGSYLAANPYPATQDNTMLLLPATTPQSAFFADYAIWVKDSKTATLLKWDEGLASWQASLEIPLTEQDGDWGYHFSPKGPNYTDLSLPFAELGITDPINSEIGLVAFASEENALRVWSVMPPSNHVDSALVTHLAPKVGQPSRMQLTEKYVLKLGDNACQQPQGRLQFEISANPGGLNFSTTNDDINLLFPPTNQALYDPFDDAYQNWLDTSFCLTYYWFTECRGNKDPTTYDIMDALATYTQVDFPPVPPDQTITYTIRYQNDSPGVYEDVWAEIKEDSASIQWPGNCNLIALGSVPADSEGIFTFTGVTNLNGAGKSHVRLINQLVGLDPDKCSYASANHLADVEIVHIPDTSAPADVTILSPRTVIGPDVVHFVGSDADASSVPMITLEVTGNDGVTQLDCPDATPGDGQWSCDWNVAASNGSVPPADGSIFSVRAKATDVFGKISEWSLPLALKVDATLPILTLDESLQGEDVLLTSALPAINGTLSDNDLVKGVEVCDENGSSCSAADLQLDPKTLPTTSLEVNDVPESSVPIPDSTQIDACTAPLERKFTVNDTFTVANLQVGFNALHPYRGDLKVTLTSPSGKQVTLMGETDNNRHNLDVLWSDSAWKLIDNDWLDHNSDAPEYQNVRRPLTPLRTFTGEQAQGEWKLSVCDMYPEDSGTYLSSRLMFTSDVEPANTQANWSFTLPNGKDLDNKTLTTTIFGVDDAGNRSLLQTLTVRVDNVAPQLGVTQSVTRSVIASDIPILHGTFGDGSAANVFVIVQDPFGTSTMENATQTEAGLWEFNLKAGESGKYTLIANAMDAAGNITSGGKNVLEVFEPFKMYVPLAIVQTGKFIISGNVQTQDGAPMAGVTVLSGGIQSVTGADGSFSLSVGQGPYVVIPQKAGYSFEPEQLMISVPPIMSNADFVGQIAAPATPTPTPTLTPTPSSTPTSTPTLTLTPTLTPSATPTNVCLNLLKNPGFETGDLGTGSEDGTQGWVFPATLYRAGFSTSVVYAGNRSARVGITLPGDDRNSYSSVWQRLDVPSSAEQATFSFALSFFSTEAPHAVIVPASADEDGLIGATSTYGIQYVILYDADTGVKIKDLIPSSWSNNPDWKTYSFTFKPGDAQYDLNTLKNRHLKLYFGVYNDVGGGVSAMYVDNTSVTTCK